MGIEAKEYNIAPKTYNIFLTKSQKKNFHTQRKSYSSRYKKPTEYQLDRGKNEILHDTVRTSETQSKGRVLKAAVYL